MEELLACHVTAADGSLVGDRVKVLSHRIRHGTARGATRRRMRCERAFSRLSAAAGVGIDGVVMAALISLSTT